jgi:hypothetical protein
VTITASVGDSGTQRDRHCNDLRQVQLPGVEDPMLHEVASGNASCTYFWCGGIKTFSAAIRGRFLTASNSADASCKVTRQESPHVDDRVRPTPARLTITAGHLLGQRRFKSDDPTGYTYLYNIEASSTHVAARSLLDAVFCGMDGYGVLVFLNKQFHLTASGNGTFCALTRPGRPMMGSK